MRGLLQAYGTPSIKKFLWNVEFSGGRWDCLDTTPGDCVYRYVEKYAAKGSILDLGCGSGSTANELAATTYRQYTGVDISDVAIAKAISRTQETGREQKADFFQFDFSSFLPNEQYDVILFRDSIYYVPTAKIGAMLERYSRYLNEGGVFIVRLWGGGGSKEKTILDIIERNFEIVEKYLSEEPKAAVIVFR
ncbi:MAG: class I SAM-dependent methyltransferase [Candidatus Korobacteraceae bacterium]